MMKYIGLGLALVVALAVVGCGAKTGGTAKSNVYGKAIPADMAKSVVAQLKEKGKVTRGWLGVMFQEVTPDLAKSFNLKDRSGALIADVLPDGPAQKAGLKRGDISIAFKGKKLTNMRSSGSVDAIQLIPPREKTLEFALEFIEDDELVEITPQNIRIRKLHLNENKRKLMDKKSNTA